MDVAHFALRDNSELVAFQRWNEKLLHAILSSNSLNEANMKELLSQHPTLLSPRHDISGGHGSICTVDSDVRRNFNVSSAIDDGQPSATYSLHRSVVETDNLDAHPSTGGGGWATRDDCGEGSVSPAV